MAKRGAALSIQAWAPLIIILFALGKESGVSIGPGLGGVLAG